VKLSAVSCLLLVALSLSPSPTAYGQVQPPVKGLAPAGQPAKWEVFVGGSWERSTSQKAYGWDGAVSEYPYKSHPWIGGTIDASGHYYNTQGKGSQLFPIMGGPSVVVNGRRVQPFARFMAGTVLDRLPATTVSLLSKPDHSVLSAGEVVMPRPPTTVGPPATSKYLGFSGGGGIDLPVSSRLAIRAQADWVGYWVNSSGQSQLQDAIRASAGIMLRY